MKAMILAAGLGSRLGNLTKNMPKPMLPIHGIPLLQTLILHLYVDGCTDIIMNLYYKSDIIIEMIEELRRTTLANSRCKLHYIVEDTLSGSAGALKKCQSFFENDSHFLVLSGDVLTALNFSEFFYFHKRMNGMATICSNRVDITDVSKFGVIQSTTDYQILKFQEKPLIQEAVSNQINSGIYAFTQKIFDYIPEKTFCDFAKDVFPKLIEHKEPFKVYETNCYWNDIGSVQSYAQAQVDALKLSCLF